MSDDFVFPEWEESCVYEQDLLDIENDLDGLLLNNDALDSLDSQSLDVREESRNHVSTRSNLCSLPTEILLRIFYELILSESSKPPKTAILSLPLVCKILYRLSHDRVVWEKAFMSEYDVSARKRRFAACNFRKLYYRRSSLNVEQMDGCLFALENCLVNQLPQHETLDNVLDILTCLWVLVSEDDERNSSKLKFLRAPEFCASVFHLLYADLDLIKSLACICIAIKIISMMLTYGTFPCEEIVESMASKLRERVLNWNPSKDAVFPMFYCHALHIYLRCIAKDEKKPMDPDSRLFDSRKSDKCLLVDVYSSNKILWCLRNDGYDWPYRPPRYWTGLCMDGDILIVEKLLLGDINFMELQIVEEHNEEEFNEDLGDIGNAHRDTTSCYLIDGTLTDDSGKTFHIEGTSIPIDKGRRRLESLVDIGLMEPELRMLGFSGFGKIHDMIDVNRKNGLNQ
ncbi:1548_t:CDS:2 [Acaulospora morrowiae]|uniref:1548_t:CDS:1 n=1 Tax=Acaulospora morrowiae TaxID=94023 RepID=A0A9N9F212_9GLOM|nr:1548_t:CDS:2 [Acaulospora morrowiae]